MTLTLYADERLRSGLNNVRIPAEEAAQLIELFPSSIGGVLVATEGNKHFELYECTGGWRLVRSKI